MRLMMIFCSAILLLPGCARVRPNPRGWYDVRVTSYLSTDLPFPPSDAASTIAVLAKTTPDAPLLEREVARKSEFLLAQRGFSIRPVGEASHVLLLFFAIDAGRTVTNSFDTYVRGGTAITNLYTGSGQWATATTRLPGRFEPRTYSYTVYSRYLGATLYAHEQFVESLADDKSDAIVWSATAVSAGSSSDVRSIIDYLLVATLDQFGKDTGKQVRVLLKESDERVLALRAHTDQRSNESPP